MGQFLDYIRELDFYELHEILISTEAYRYFFPLLLLYAILYTVLSQVGIFRKTDPTDSNKTQPRKPIIVAVSISISVIATIYPINEQGETIGDFLVVFFPNISALTMGLLGLFLVSTLMGKNFLDFFGDHVANSYAQMAIFLIGLGSVLFFIGNAAGFWNYNVMDPGSQWNFILMIGLLVLGIVLIALKIYAVGIILLLVDVAYLANHGNNNILEYIFDPFIFMIAIFLILFTWVSSGDKDEEAELEEKIKKQEEELKKYSDAPKLDENYDYNYSRIYPILKSAYDSNKKKLDKIKKKKGKI